VMPARLRGRRDRGGGAAELLLLQDLGQDRWLCLARPAKRMRVGDVLSFRDDALIATIREIRPDGQRVVRLAAGGRSPAEMLTELGEMPLPPYIHRRLDNPERYQTVYARDPGSSAAPTAGLHFTTELLDEIQQRGVTLGFVTLHVGLGTFRPVQVEDITKHHMHAEFGILPLETALLLKQARDRGNRVVVVGTTALRVLESAALEAPGASWSGWTDIFIYPGFRFQVADALVTNFHLPRSTLLMLVSAFAGKELIDRAYAAAIAERYRFFSFGDAMLIT
jgi:S-adenosylmethionine:tRNA ribosyltransferase-isomerase